MKLTIKYFASLRERLGIAEETVELTEQELTIDALRARLAAKSSRAADALRPGRPVRCAFNKEIVAGTFIVREDSEIAFFPPVTGG